MAQDRECPEGFTCLTPGATHCLSEAALNGQEKELEACREDREEMRGRVEECRDGEAACHARVENLVAEKTAYKAENAKLKIKLKKWFRKPEIWVPITAALAGLGYLGGRLHQKGTQ